MKTAGKMSDLVMESVSQFIARDYLEAYDRIMKEERYEFVPAEFDDKIYKKIGNLIRKKTGYSNSLFRKTMKVIAAAISLSCIGFTVAVLANDVLRQEIFSIVGF